MAPRAGFVVKKEDFHGANETELITEFRTLDFNLIKAYSRQDIDSVAACHYDVLRRDMAPLAIRFSEQFKEYLNQTHWLPNRSRLEAMMKEKQGDKK